MFFENLIIKTARKAYGQSKKSKFIGFVLVFGIFFLPLILLSAFTYHWMSNQLNEMTLSRRHAIAVPIVHLLDQELDNLVDFGRYMSLNPELRKQVEAKNWSPAMEIIKTHLILAEDKPIERSVLVDIAGVAQVWSDLSTTTPPGDFSYRDWYKGVMLTGKPYVSEVYQRQLPQKKMWSRSPCRFWEKIS